MDLVSTMETTSRIRLMVDMPSTKLSPCPWKFMFYYCFVLKFLQLYVRVYGSHIVLLQVLHAQLKSLLPCKLCILCFIVDWFYLILLMKKNLYKCYSISYFEWWNTFFILVLLFWSLSKTDKQEYINIALVAPTIWLIVTKFKRILAVLIN